MATPSQTDDPSYPQGDENGCTPAGFDWMNGYGNDSDADDRSVTPDSFTTDFGPGTPTSGGGTPADWGSPSF